MILQSRFVRIASYRNSLLGLRQNNKIKNVFPIKLTRIFTVEVNNNSYFETKNSILSSEKVIEIPLSLQKYLQRLINDAVIKALQSETSQPAVDIVLIQQQLYFQLINGPKYSSNFNLLVETCLILVKAIDLNPDHLASRHISIFTLIDKYEKYIEINKTLFKTIQDHHNGMIEKDWDTIVSDNSSLVEYSKAASLMGEKKWVVESNKWLENFSLSFFRFNSAKKHFIKKLKAKLELENVNNKEIRSQIEKKISDAWYLPKDLMQIDNNNQISKIRLLDVGSCYNPLGKSENVNLFDITAIDLLPADPSVYQCDFLNIKVLEEGSKPIIDGNKIIGLPEKSFDVVTMSLVLSYLPNPSQREEMVKIAKKLLVAPRYNNQPHRTGLLLIIEKESIFAKEQVANNEMEYIHNWRTTISNYGFELVKYRFLKATENKNVHAFAFATIDSDGKEENNSDLLNVTNDNMKKPTLWISQDFVAKDNSNNNNINTSSAVLNISNSSLTPLPVGIVGGGLGGSALALSLQRKGLPFILFEKDRSFSIRKQGYALTMQQGGTSLRLLGLSNELFDEGVISTAHCSYNKDGVKIGAYGRNIRNGEYTKTENSENIDIENNNNEKKTKSRYNIHIPRQKLRELLVKDIKPEHICWDKSLVSYCKANDNNVNLVFSDATSYNVSVLVGADGIYSTVYQLMGRKQLLNSSSDSSALLKLNYLGVMVILGISPRPSVMSMVDDKLIYCQNQWLDGETRVFSMPFDRNKTMWQLSFPIDENSAKDICFQKRLKEEALNRCSGWTSQLVDLISATEDDYISGHPAYDRDPISPSFFTSDGRVTLLGDSAHPMSPFKGQGANQALLDAISLSKAIVSSNISKPGRRPVEEALREYEKEMCVRSQEKVSRSRDASVYLHNPAAILAVGNITRAKAAEDYFTRNNNNN